MRPVECSGLDKYFRKSQNRFSHSFRCNESRWRVDAVSAFVLQKQSDWNDQFVGGES